MAVSLDPPRTHNDRTDVAWWVTAALTSGLLLWTRLTGLSRSLWWDEVFTAQRYVRGEFGVIFDAGAYSPNNHVLYSVLANLSASVFGISEVVLRLLVVVPALAGLGLLAWSAYRLVGTPLAVVVLGLATASPIAARFATEARGYGIVLLAATVMLVVTVHAARRPTWAADLAVAGAGLTAMLTFAPSVTLYLAHAGVWFLRRRLARLRLVLLTAASGVVTALVLSPLLPRMFEWSDEVGSRHGEPSSWSSPLVAPLRLLGGESLGGALPAGGLAAGIAVLLGIAGLVWLWPRASELALQVFAALTGTMVLLLLVGYHLVPRYLAFLLPHVLVAVAAGVVGLATWLCGGRRALADGVTIAVVAVLVILSYGAVQDQTNVPAQDFKGATAAVLAEDPAVIVSWDLHVGYHYYLGRDAVKVVRDIDGVEAAFCRGPRPAVYLLHVRSEREEEPSCLDQATRQEVEQRYYGGSMGWYVLR
jgi:mannosyltransferase